MRDYLDKLIQVPIQVPKLGVQEVRDYLFLLFAIGNGIDAERIEALRAGLEKDLQQAWRGEPLTKGAALALLGNAPGKALALGFEIADRIAPLLATSSQIMGNPRIVKRMLNLVRLRSRIAGRRGMPLDEAVIAKMALFERCLDSGAIRILYQLINEAGGGKPELLKKLEGLAQDPDKFKDACPDAWKKPETLSFLMEWMTLEPSLSDMDLRPAVYLSRETSPLRMSRGGLSGPAMEAVRILLKAPNRSSPSAKLAVNAVDQSEHVQVMEALIAEFRKHADWKNKPHGFDGALLLADVSIEAGEALAWFIQSLLQTKLPPWLNQAVKDEKWFKAATRS